MDDGFDKGKTECHGVMWKYLIDVCSENLAARPSFYPELLWMPYGGIVKEIT